MILIIGQQADPHIQAVTKRLNDVSAHFIVFDVYSENTFGLKNDVSQNFEISIGQNARNLNDIKSVWWRQKPKFQVPSDTAVGLYDYYFVQREWNIFFDYVVAKTSDCWAINNRAYSRLAENKAYQLELAGKFNFTLPQTIITNSVSDAYRFFDSAQIDRCVYKSFSPYISPEAKIAYTTEVDLKELLNSDHQDSIGTTPGIFQELIQAEYELRVTVVGEQVFAVKIEVPSCEKHTDWRASTTKNHYEKYVLDSELTTTLLEYHKKLGLYFAAYDFMVDKNSRVYFLEGNPSGQWMWIEEAVGMPISGAIANSLIQKK